MNALGIGVRRVDGSIGFCPVNARGFLEVTRLDGQRVEASNTLAGQAASVAGNTLSVRDTAGVDHPCAFEIGSRQVSPNPVRLASAGAGGRGRGGASSSVSGGTSRR